MLDGITQERNSIKQPSTKITFKLSYINASVWDRLADSEETGKVLSMYCVEI